VSSSTSPDARDAYRRTDGEQEDLSMAAVTGLAGVLVWTEAERFPAMRAFYVDVLGLTPRSDRPGFVNFEWGAQRLTIHLHDEVHGPTVEPHRVMINLAVEGIEELVDRAEAAGVPVRRPPERESWGGVVATLADPDGTSVQLFELP
jgi:predicted enzyme related to lactoylglutathione lyase